MKENLKDIILEAVSHFQKIPKSDLTSYISGVINGSDSEKDKIRKVKPEYLIARTIKSMIERDLLKEFPDNTVMLSESGLTHIERKHIYKDVIPSPNFGARNGVWDGLWRIVILNFSEDERIKRDLVRNVLKEAGFKSIKQSIWASPFVCEPLIAEIKRKLELKFEIILLTSRHIDPPIDLLLEL